MGFADDYGIAATLQLLCFLTNEWKFLERRDNDRRTVFQRFGQLRGILIDLFDHALLVLKLVDVVLQLPVEDNAVGDNHDGVEDLAILSVMQTGQPMRKPGDRVALPAAG